MKKITHTIAAFVLAGGLFTAQETPAQEGTNFDGATKSLEQDLKDSLDELDALYEELKDKKLPLDRELTELEAELSALRAEQQEVLRLVDDGALAITNLNRDIERGEKEVNYLENLLGSYLREFGTRIHVSEKGQYDALLEEANLAPESSNLSKREVFDLQLALAGKTIDRLEAALGGVRFEGEALNANRLLTSGTFVLVGPTALFRSNTSDFAGTIEERLGSWEPAEIAFANEEDAAAAASLVSGGEGFFPLDPTLGDAHKLEATEQETFLEHVEKGGPVMYPIFTLAGIALLLALYKWGSMAVIGRPSRRSVQALMDAVGNDDEEKAQAAAVRIKGPVGRMLAAGVVHLKEPRELIEEVMYETVLTTRLKLQRFLPFIAICAASAPLLGLLGTVTGIISTFKLITVYGSGDVKSLSGGISEALITTKFGLIVAVPSLLIHAFLSRKAKGVIDQMEKAALGFLNQVGRVRPESMRSAELTAAPSQEVLRTHVREALQDMLSPLVGRSAGEALKRREQEQSVRAQVEEALNDMLAPIVREESGHTVRSKGRGGADLRAEPEGVGVGSD